jgi:error-prone DNA polymerase
MVHLHTHSWFSFLGGTSSPAALVKAAAELGQPALALTDTHTLSGAVQFARACQRAGIKPLFGATVEVDGFPLVLLCQNREGYANLCDLLTLAHADRLHPHLDFEQLWPHTEGLLCLTGDRWGYLATAIREQRFVEAQEFLQQLKALFRERLYLEVTHHQRPGDGQGIRWLAQLGEECDVPLVATNAVRHARAGDYALYDALTCARLGLTVGDPHPLRPVNNRAFLRAEAKLQELGVPVCALSNTYRIAEMCDVELLPDSVTPPQALVPPGLTPTRYLWQLCQASLQRKFPGTQKETTRRARATLKHEMAVITELGLEEFFLVVREVVEFARSQGIRCSGRGSAANSLVAYLLGITPVDPIQHNLLFERFLHTGRRGMPDIDVDFQSDRRDEVIAWMAQHFGEAHTAMAANVITFRLRLAVREMAKVLGYPLPLIDQVSKILPHGSARKVREHRAAMAAILGESVLLENLLCLVEALPGCPRHLSLHSGGMILSRALLRTLSPIQTSANSVRQLQFNKDDVEALGLIKFDVLGLRMLSVVSETVELLRQKADATEKEKAEDKVPGQELAPAPLQVPDVKAPQVPDVDALPLDDKKAFELIRSGQTMSVFQIESPGQWNLLSRTQPETFDDLVAQVALFRPGPLQGGFVHPFARRRRKQEAVTYPHPSLESVLKDTQGIVLYQEQVLEIAHVFAGLSLAQADEFRRLMSKFRNSDEMEGMRQRFVEGAVAKHEVAPAVANEVFDIIAKFVGYGFCRSHAASFAQIVYQTAYLKAHHPAQYMAAVMQHHPGFYPINTLLEEARHLGVPVLPVDVTCSGIKYFVEQNAIRVPLTQIKGLSVESAAAIVGEREAKAFVSLEDLYRRVELSKDLWDALARSGALSPFGRRRRVLWELGILRRRLGTSGGARLALEAGAHDPDETPAIKKLGARQQMVWDFQTQGLTTGPHPLELCRPALKELGVAPIRTLWTRRPGGRVLVGGMVIVRQRPPTANGMCFLVLEDESGRIQVAVTPPVFEKHQELLRLPMLMVEGVLEDASAGINRGQSSNGHRSILAWRLLPVPG